MPSPEMDRSSDPNAPIIPTDYGKRVIPDGREAPRLMLPFTCSLCGYVLKLDAYGGPYSCGSHESMYYKPYLTLVPMIPKPVLPEWWNKGVPFRHQPKHKEESP